MRGRAATRAAVVLVGGLALSAVAALYQANRLAEIREREFTRLAQDTLDDLLDTMRNYERGLRGLRGAVTALGPQRLTRQAFDAYSRTRDVAREFPGARGFGFIARVAQPQSQSFIEQAKLDGFPDFEIRQFAPRDGERWPILYVAPLDMNRQAVGADAASDLSRRSAMERALRTGEASLTAPITLLQADQARSQSFLLVLPVALDAGEASGAAIAQPPSASTPAGLAAAAGSFSAGQAWGWTFAPIVMQEVVQASRMREDLVRLSITDVTPAVQGTALLPSAVPAAASLGAFFSQQGGVSAGPAVDVEREIFGRRWRMQARPTPAFMMQPLGVTPQAVAATGGALSALLAFIAGVLRSQALQRRSDSDHRLRLAAVVQRSRQGFALIDEQGSVTHWSEAAQALTGYTPDKVLGTRLQQLLAGSSDVQAYSLALQRTLREGATGSLAASIKHQAGHGLELHLTMEPIFDESRNLAGASVTLRTPDDAAGLGDAVDGFRPTSSAADALSKRSLHSDYMGVAAVIASRSLYSIADSDGRILEVNDLFCTISGYSRDELVGQNHRIVNSGIHTKAFWSAMWAMIKSGRTWQAEVCNRTKTGVPYWVDATVVPITNAAGGIERFVSILTDITARKRAQQVLAAERERLENVLRGTDAGTWEWDVDSGRVEVDDRWASIVGYRREQLMPHIDMRTRLAHPHELGESRRLLREHMQGRSDIYSFEGRLRHQDGHWVWVLDRGRVLKRGPDGRAQRLIGTLLDITATKQATLALQERERQLRLVVEAFPGRLAYWDRHLTCRFASGSFRDMGLSPSEMIGKTRHELFAAVGEQATNPHVEKALEGREASFERTVADGQGASRQFLVHYIPDVDGTNVRGFVSAAIDVTDLKAVQRSLELRSRQAEVANEAKSAFVANISHEIRTPLNAIIGAHALLADASLAPDQRKLFEMAQLASRSLLAIVNDVLDLSKIESGEMVLEERAFDLHELLRASIGMQQLAAQRKALSLSLELDADVPQIIMGDSTRLQQVLSNLLSNAIKFTQEGSIRLTASMIVGENDLPWLRLSVIDTGIGISPQAQAKLFQPFVQAEASTTRNYGGTGLGLSIVGQIVEMMGGRVGISSVEGVGSRFWVDIEPRMAGGTGASPGKPLQVLVIDDSPEDRLAISGLCRRLGWRARGIGDVAGTRGLVDQALGEGERAEVVVVQWGMASLPCEQAIDTIRRALGGSGAAFFVTSRGQSGEAQAAAARAGAEGVLVKPLDATGLFDAVSGALARRGIQGASHAAPDLSGPPAHRLDGLRVLVVDDSSVNLEVARMLLERAGASVRCALSAEQAYSSLRESPSDAVVMDVQMPAVDGLVATRHIRAQPAWADLPIVGLSAGAMLEERHLALDAGMDDFLTKPINPVDLVRVLRKHAQRRGWRPVTPEPRASQVSGLGGATTELTGQWPELAGINARNAAARVAGDQALHARLLRNMLAEFSDLASDVEPLPVWPDDALEIAQRAHKLGGAATQLGADALGHSATQLERILLCRQDGSAVAARQDVSSQLQALAMEADRVLGPDPRALEALILAPRADGEIHSQCASPQAEPLGAQQRQWLRERLRKQGLDALDWLEANGSRLAVSLTSDAYSRVVALTDELDFAALDQLLGDESVWQDAPGPGESGWRPDVGADKQSVEASNRAHPDAA